MSKFLQQACSLFCIFLMLFSTVHAQEFFIFQHQQKRDLQERVEAMRQAELTSARQRTRIPEQPSSAMGRPARVARGSDSKGEAGAAIPSVDAAPPKVLAGPSRVDAGLEPVVLAMADPPPATNEGGGILDESASTSPGDMVQRSSLAEPPAGAAAQRRDPRAPNDVMSEPLAGVTPMADPGGPYQEVAANRMDGGWTFTFDGSGSMPGAPESPLVSWVWDFGTDAFDGRAINLFKWDAYGALQDDQIVISAHGSAWRNRFLSRELIQRTAGAIYEAAVTPRQTNAYGVWGLKIPNATYREVDMAYGIYFHADGNVHTVDGGSVSGGIQPYSANTPYDVRIELKPTAGARILIRPSGTPDWVVLRDSVTGTTLAMAGGMVVYSGTYALDDVRQVHAGQTITRKVYAPGPVFLTVTDINGISDTAVTSIDIAGDPLEAVANGPYVLDAADRVGLSWPTTFDSMMSLSTNEIIQSQWDFGTNTFDGEWLNADRWDYARAGQHDRIELIGAGSWSSWFIERRTLPRANGAFIEATITPKQTNAYAVFGFKTAGAPNYREADMAHGLYIHADGSIHIVEGGSVGGGVRPYTANTPYDFRIELKEGCGARYFMRQSGAGAWDLLGETGTATQASFQRGMVVYSGRYDFDNLREVFWGEPMTRNIHHAEPLTLTVTDAIGQSDSADSPISTFPDAPTAVPGGPYAVQESLATDYGLPLQLDAADSTSGAAIVRHEWRLGVETFDGVRLDERRWVSARALQNGEATLTGTNVWGSGYLYETQPFYRADGASASAKLRSTNHTMFGFKDTTTGVNHPNMDYAIYFAIGTFHVYEDGNDRGAFGTYTPGDWYDVRVTLLPNAGATYWIRPSGQTEWQLMYVSSYGTATEFRRGLTHYGGTATLDDWHNSSWGQAADAAVVGPGDVQLTVDDAGGQADAAATSYAVQGDPPAANAGSDIALAEPDHANGVWNVVLDGAGSSDDVGIVSYLWDFGPEAFDGTAFDGGAWFSAMAAQDGKLTVTGTNAWGSGYAFHQTPVERQYGAYVQARVNSSGAHTMWGLKDTTTSYNYPAMVYAIYFVNNGSINIYEGGTDRGAWGSYSPNVDYDVRIELKVPQGARYMMRPAGASDWTTLYESLYSTTASMIAGCTVHSGSFSMDDVRRTVSGVAPSYRIRREGAAALTVFDAAWQSSTDSTNYYILGDPPTAAISAATLVPVTSFAYFDASGSTDDFGIVRYEWDFGDGQTGLGRTVRHVYATPGVRTASLTVYDVAGRSDTATVDIDVQPMVVCAPWRYDTVSGSEIPHTLWDGLSTTLKGVVYTDTPVDQLTYTWTHGDGTGSVSGSVTNKRVIEAPHSYIGAPGTLFTARLTVQDPVYGELSDTYPMIIEPEDLNAEINVAIDEALWYLHKQQQADGRWTSYGSYYAASTASAVQAMEINGHVPAHPVASDPLVEDVVRGLQRMLIGINAANIAPQTAGNPDSNGNGIGVTVSTDRPIYEGGMVMDALAAGAEPDMLADTGSANVINRTFREIAQDMADMYAWGQVDAGALRGGWRYSWNSDADNSACQWAAIGLLGARTAMGIDAPGFVKQENALWLAYTQRADGRFGYANNGDAGCDSFRATTPSGMVQLAWLDVQRGDTRWSTAEDWIANNWTFWRNSNNVYAWYAFAKAMRTAVPQPVVNLAATGLDWFKDPSLGLAPYIINRQNANGSWPDSSAGCGINIGVNFSTAWQTIILTTTLFNRPPVAVAGSSIVWACELPLEFNGCASYHLDPARRIVQYEWDFDGDGTFDYVGANCSVEHTYTLCPPEGSPETYTAVLRVTDDIGNVDTDTREVIIAAPPHPPIAEADGPYTAYTGIPFIPDGSGSFDIDPTDYITRQEWDFDGGDGYDFDNPDAAVDCESPPASCPEVAWTFATPGDYNIGLRVWDSGVLSPPGCTVGVDCLELASAPDFSTVRVLLNRAPVADAGGPYIVNECTAAQLDGSLSFDPDGNPLYFFWDLDNDGEFDDAAGVAPTFTWTEDGAYTIGLRVTDLALESIDVATVTVNDLSPMVALSGPTQLIVDQQGCFSATTATPCDDIAAVDWDWDYLDPPGFIPSGDTGTEICHTYTEHGVYAVAVRVTDEDGDIALATQIVIVEPEDAGLQPVANDIQVIYIRRGYLPELNQHYAEASLKNVGNNVIRGPIVLAFDLITPPGSYLVNPDGVLPDNGLAYINFTPLLGDNLLQPGEQTGFILIHWQVVGDQELFSFVDIPYALNSAPYFTTAPVLAATEGVPYRYHAHAEDPDGNALIYLLTNGPADMTISRATGLLKWTPGQMDAGVHSVSISATDGFVSGTAMQTFDVTVSAVNVPPIFTSTPATLATAGTQWCYNVEAEDPDGDAVTVSLVSGPQDMMYDDGAGMLCWTPSQAGQAYVKLAATDGSRIATQEFFVTVVECVGGPIISSIPVLSGVEGQLYEYDVDAAGGSGDSIVYSLEVAPTGMTINANTGLIRWTPGQRQGGPRVVKVAAMLSTDSLCRDEQIFEIDVQSVNVAPIITSMAPATAVEGSLYWYPVTAMDPDGDIVTYRLDFAPPGMDIDPDVGFVGWTPSQTAARDYPSGVDVTVAVCDPFGACALEEYTIDITMVNVAPRIVSPPVYAATEGQAYSYPVIAVDDDDDPIQFSLPDYASDPDGTDMTIDSAGVITWAPSQTSSRRNPHPVRVVASDSVLQAAQTYEVFVADVNLPPAVSPIAPQFADEGDIFTLQIVATDPDGDTLTFTRTSSQPDGLNVHPANGSIEWNTGCASAGVYTVAVEVSDGKPNGVTPVEFDLTVNDINCGPYITSTPPLRAAVNRPYAYDVQAFDPEGLPVACALGSGPAGMAVAADCRVTWTPADTGAFPVQIAVSDDITRDCAAPASWCQEFSIDVVPCLSPPEIVSIPSLTAAVANQYTYQLEIEAGEPDAPMYELVQAPAGMDISGGGAVTWLPSMDQIGMHDVVVAVRTGHADCRVEQPFTLEVIECSDPPIITTMAPATAAEAAEYVYDVDAIPGQPTDMLTYELLSAPAAMTIDDQTGEILWTPSRADVGNHYVRLRVLADRLDCRGEQVFRLTVNAVEIFPTITSVCPSFAYVGETYQCDVEAVDVNGDELRFSLPRSQVAPTTPPAGMSIDEQTGLITWTPALADLGVRHVTVRVEEADGPGFDEQDFDVEVVVNSPPVITSIAPTVAVVDANYTYDVDADDADGDTLEFALLTGPPGMSIGSTDGIIQWVAAAGDEGPHDVSVHVHDGHGGEDTQAYTFTVVPAGTNVPPVITSAPPVIGTPDCRYTYAVKAVDANGDALACSLPGQFPAGMTIDPDTCLAEWTPSASQLGMQAVHVRVAEVSTADLFAADQSYTIDLTANTPPVAASTPVATATVGATYLYDVDAGDAEGDAITYDLVTAPAGMTINPATGLITWRPGPGDVGPLGASDYTVVVTLDDGRCGYASQTYRLYVYRDAEAPVITLIAPVALNPAVQTFPIFVTATDNIGVTSLSLSVDDAPVPINRDGIAYYSSTGPGLYNIVATASDAAGNNAVKTAQTIAVNDVTAPPPELLILSPSDGAEITEPADIVGRVRQSNLAYWTLSYRPAGGGSADYVQIGYGATEVNDQVIGRLDPTMLLNGLYNVRLYAIDFSGRYYEHIVTYSVAGGMKIGHFTLTYTDVAAPVGNIPMIVTRTYDSRNKTKGDFGIGWTLDVANIVIEESGPMHEGWSYQIYPGPFGLLNYVPIPLQAHVVNVRWPDGRTDRFTPEFVPPIANVFQWIVGVQVRFKAVTGTATLTSNADNGRFFVSGTQLIGAIGGDVGRPYSPDVYTLTRADGTAFNFAGAGLTAKFLSMRDANGNSLTVTHDGIIHSAGQSIVFQRDAQDRIIAVIDPNGAPQTYAYDGRGDLVAVTDAAGSTTQYRYNAVHHITDILDPLGRRVARNEYDDDGRLIAFTDANGNRIEVTHNLDGREEIVRDRLGNVTRYVYNERGKVLMEEKFVTIDGMVVPSVKTMTYDERDNLLTETGPYGHTTTYTYDENDNKLSQTDPLGNTTAYTYDSAGRMLTLTDALGHTTTKTYDTLGNNLSIIDPNGNVTRFTYDIRGNQTSVIDPVGNITTYEYNSAGRPTRKVDPLGNESRYVYDDNGNMLTETMTVSTPAGPQTAVTQRAYDGEGRVRSVTDAENKTTLIEYDAVGHRSAVIDPLGRRTEYRFNVLGWLEETRYADGASEYYMHDAEGRETATVDRAGRTTHYVRDELGAFTEIIFPDDTPEDLSDNPRMRGDNDKMGRPTVRTSPFGNRTEYEYDNGGRLTVKRCGCGGETIYGYDALGRRTSETDQLNRTTQFVYDAVNRLIETRFPDASREYGIYNALGQEVAFIDQAGRMTQFEHDAMGRVVSVMDAAGGRTEYAYDGAGNLVSQTNAKGNTTLLEYDKLGRRTAMTLPMGQRWTTVYDDAGNIVSVTDFNNNSTVFQYDNMNQLTARLYPNGSSVSFTYTPTGRRAAATDARGVTMYLYDAQDRLTSRIEPDGRAIEYTYDAPGNLAAVTTPAGSTSYTLDSNARLESVTDPDGGTTVYSYNEVGNVVQIQLPNGTTQTREYDELNRLTAVENSGPGGIISNYQYTLDGVGNRVQVTENSGRTVDYEYDAIYRLIGETINEPPGSTQTVRSIAYTYDSVGNRLSRVVDDGGALSTTTYMYDANDRLTRDIRSGVQTGYAYDGNGNVLSQVSPGNQVQYAWNYENLLTQADIVTPNSAQRLQFKYDADGVRVASTVDGAETRFLNDGNGQFANVVEEYAADGALQASYAYGRGLISQSRGGERWYYHGDGLGSARVLTDSAGAVAASYDYEAFGRLLASSGSVVNDYRFAGERYQPGLNAYYLRARYYLQNLGRFASADPFPGYASLPLSLHKYIYGYDNPVMNIDPSGLNTISYALTTDSIAIPAIPALKLTGLEVLVLIAIAAITVCAINGEICKNPLPILFHGIDMPETTLHVAEAIGSFTRLRIPISIITPRSGGGGPPVLIRRPGSWPRGWYNSQPACNGVARAAYALTHLGDRGVCDEYPFASTWNGGQANYLLGLVSIKLTPSWEGTVQGNAIRNFYSACQVIPEHPIFAIFGVVPVIVPTTYDCGSLR